MNHAPPSRRVLGQPLSLSLSPPPLPPTLPAIDHKTQYWDSAAASPRFTCTTGPRMVYFVRMLVKGLTTVYHVQLVVCVCVGGVTEAELSVAC